MKRSYIFLHMFLFSVLCFAQQNAGIKVIGKIPDITDNRLYQIQVGAFRLIQNAANAYDKLRAASLNPSYEQYQDIIRVLINGVSAKDVSAYIEKIRRAGFSEVYIKVDPAGLTADQPPVSETALPLPILREIAYRTVKVGETKSLADLVTGKNITLWESSTPSTVSVNSSGVITGLKIGSAYIKINETEYISIAVVPAEDVYILPDSETSILPKDSKIRESFSINSAEYITEPTFRLAYGFMNKGENRGASGENGGLDILGRGPDYEWLWTTYYQGGWFYDLNGIQHEMINGYQQDPHNGVELIVKPEFVYDKGTPYLQLRHILRNPGSNAVSGQKFGASADVMIHKNDDAPLSHRSYGAYMTDSETTPALELMLVCESEDGIDPVDTLWLDRYGGGLHLERIYDNNRSDLRYDDSRSKIHVVDSAIGFSYQNIDLAPGQEKEFVIRFSIED
jgi:hypothetical protein